MIRIINFSLFLLVINVACQQKANDKEKATMVGNDADKNGCKASAGYSWSVIKNKCVRIFEDGIRLNPVDTTQKTEIISIFTILADDGTKAEVFLPNLSGSIILPKTKTDDTWANDSLNLSHLKGTYTLEKNKKAIYRGAVVAK